MNRASFFALFISLFIYCTSVNSQVVTKSFIIQKLASTSSKDWFKKGGSAKKERADGDMKYVFSKRNMKFTIYQCNSLLKWIQKEQYAWSIEPEGDNTPTGYHHWLLKIGNHYASFRFDLSYKTLYLKLYGKDSQLVLE